MLASPPLRLISCLFLALLSFLLVQPVSSAPVPYAALTSAPSTINNYDDHLLPRTLEDAKDFDKVNAYIQKRFGNAGIRNKLLFYSGGKWQEARQVAADAGLKWYNDLYDDQFTSEFGVSATVDMDVINNLSQVMAKFAQDDAYCVGCETAAPDSVFKQIELPAMKDTGSVSSVTTLNTDAKTTSDTTGTIDVQTGKLSSKSGSTDPTKPGSKGGNGGGETDPTSQDPNTSDPETNQIPDPSEKQPGETSTVPGDNDPGTQGKPNKPSKPSSTKPGSTVKGGKP